MTTTELIRAALSEAEARERRRAAPSLPGAPRDPVAQARHHIDTGEAL